jgi:hypothetical protein
MIEPHKLSNGSRGVVVRFVGRDNERLPVVKFVNGRELVIQTHVWHFDRGPHQPQLTRTQLPLDLAWVSAQSCFTPLPFPRIAFTDHAVGLQAVTIHKSQSLTLDRAVLDVEHTFGFAMLYVGLSRVRSINDVQVIGFQPSKVKADPDAIRFYQKEPAMHPDLINVDPPSVIRARVAAHRANVSGQAAAGAAGAAAVTASTAGRAVPPRLPLQPLHHHAQPPSPVPAAKPSAIEHSAQMHGAIKPKAIGAVAVTKDVNGGTRDSVGPSSTFHDLPRPHSTFLSCDLTLLQELRALHQQLRQWCHQWVERLGSTAAIHRRKQRRSETVLV